MKFTDTFRATITQAYEQLFALPLEKTTQKPAPDKWSPIEILGHLIDSANNNHRRFVKAQWQDNMVFDGYQQDLWVKAQQYQSADWQQLLDLWRLYNLHICQIMENTPEEKLLRSMQEHNLDRIAYQTVPASQPVTLKYFMEDYIGHLVHHLRQINRLMS